MKTSLTVLFLFSFVVCSAQDGNVFPYMEAESLTNEMINLPNDIQGSYSLIALAFSKKSESDLGSWFQPIYSQFLQVPDPNAFFSFDYDLNVFIIPMFTGAKRAAYQKTMKKVQKTVDPKLQKNVLFYKGTISEYKKALNFEGKDLPYFYVLDSEGVIVYSTSGRYTRNKMQEVIDAVEPAAK
jgi:hypothetical protein